MSGIYTKTTRKQNPQWISVFIFLLDLIVFSFLELFSLFFILIIKLNRWYKDAGREGAEKACFGEVQR